MKGLASSSQPTQANLPVGRLLEESKLKETFLNYAKDYRLKPTKELLNQFLFGEVGIEQSEQQLPDWAEELT